MILWRISNYATLDGQGGLSASARWHTQGHAIVYLAETPAGALLELLVHLELDAASLPGSYQLLKAAAPDEVAVQTKADSDLPSNWREDLLSTRTVGDEWLAARSTALLRVPSVIVPETYNVLLNPRHTDAARVKVLWHRRYGWDKRLLNYF